MLIFDYNKYGGSDLNGKIIVKSSEMPVPSAEYNGEIYIYAGETSETYTHGYIYECKSETTYTALIGLEPTKIAFDYTLGEPAEFFKKITPDYAQIVGGRFKYYENADIWNINGLDSEGNTIFENYQLYSQDLIDAGFVFIVPMADISDEEELEYYLNYTATTNYKWERIDVQPSVYDEDGTATVKTPDGSEADAVVNVEYVNNIVGNIDNVLDGIIEQEES